MKIDAHITFLLTMLIVSALMALLPLTGSLPRPEAWETATAIVCGLLSSFALGKRFGERVP